MNYEGNMTSAESRMKELGAHVKGITAVLPALSIVSMLAGKEFMEEEMEKLNAMAVDICNAADAVNSNELESFFERKGHFSRSLEKLRNTDLKGSKEGLIIIIRSAPEILARAANYISEHTDDLIRILENHKNGKDKNNGNTYSD